MSEMLTDVSVHDVFCITGSEEVKVHSLEGAFIRRCADALEGQTISTYGAGEGLYKTKGEAQQSASGTSQVTAGRSHVLGGGKFCIKR